MVILGGGWGTCGASCSATLARLPQLPGAERGRQHVQQRRGHQRQRSQVPVPGVRRHHRRRDAVPPAGADTARRSARRSSSSRPTTKQRRTWRAYELPRRRGQRRSAGRTQGAHGVRRPDRAGRHRLHGAARVDHQPDRANGAARRRSSTCSPACTRRRRARSCSTATSRSGSLRTRSRSSGSAARSRNPAVPDDERGRERVVGMYCRTHSGIVPHPAHAAPAPRRSAIRTQRRASS